MACANHPALLEADVDCQSQTSLGAQKTTRSSHSLVAMRRSISWLLRLAKSSLYSIGRHRTSRRCTTFPLPSRLYFVEEYGGGCAIAVQHLRCGDPPLYEFGYQVGSDLHVSNLNAKPQRHTFPVMTCTLLPTKPMPASPFLIIARMLRKTLSFGPASSH